MLIRIVLVIEVFDESNINKSDNSYLKHCGNCSRNCDYVDDSDFKTLPRTTRKTTKEALYNVLCCRKEEKECENHGEATLKGISQDLRAYVKKTELECERGK